MIPDRLFDLALQYKKAKLWKKLWDSQLFAVRFSDGDIGYCCVMGMAGELNAIAVYPGQKGLDSLRMLHDADDGLDDLDRLERIRCQDCLMLSFMNKSELNPRDVEAVTAYCKAKGVSLRGRNAYPQFERFRTGYERWYLEDETDQQHLVEALEAALEVADRLTREMKTPEQLGQLEDALYDRDITLLTKAGGAYQWATMPLPPREAVEWPPIVIDDDLSRARLEKAPRKGEWGARLFRYFEPTTFGDSDAVAYDDLEEPPFFSWVLMLVDLRSGRILSMTLSDSPDDYTRSLAKFLVDTVANSGMPHRIVVLDDRTQAALGDFCERFNVGLDRKKRCKPLQNALDDMLEHFFNDPDEEIEDEIEEMFELLREPGFVASLPDEMVKTFFTEVDPREVPDDIREIMYKEAVRRGFIRR